MSLVTLSLVAMFALIQSIGSSTNFLLRFDIWVGFLGVLCCMWFLLKFCLVSINFMIFGVIHFFFVFAFSPQEYPSKLHLKYRFSFSFPDLIYFLMALDESHSIINLNGD